MAGIPRIKVYNYGTYFYGHEFSLLDTLEVHEVPAPFNCRGGYCGCCKVRLLDGEVEMVQDSLFDLPEGEILTCCCKPKTHIEIEIPSE